MSIGYVCKICKFGIFMHSTCHYESLFKNLIAIFACPQAHYEISITDGTVTCFTKEDIIWGRLVVPKHNRANWLSDGAHAELYFTSTEKYNLHFLIENLNIMFGTISRMPSVLPQIAQHGIHFV